MTDCNCGSGMRMNVHRLDADGDVVGVTLPNASYVVTGVTKGPGRHRVNAIAPGDSAEDVITNMSTSDDENDSETDRETDEPRPASREELVDALALAPGVTRDELEALDTGTLHEMARDALEETRELLRPNAADEGERYIYDGGRDVDGYGTGRRTNYEERKAREPEHKRRTTRSGVGRSAPRRIKNELARWSDPRERGRGPSEGQPNRANFAAVPGSVSRDYDEREPDVSGWPTGTRAGFEERRANAADGSGDADGHPTGRRSGYERRRGGD